MTRRRTRAGTATDVALAFALSAVLATPGAASAQQQLYAYPTKGQSQDQQRKDIAECHTWAIGQTGFNPNTAAPVTAYGAPPPRESGLFGRGEYGEGGGVLDLAKGAGLGAIGGAIAGNAGTGAAIGALAGGLFGGIKRSERDAERRQWEEQQAAQIRAEQQRRDQQMAGYNRAFAACVGARGYAVK